MTIDRCYSKYKNLMYSLAWKSHKRFPWIDLDDFISRGHEVMMNCAAKDNGNDTFSTYLFKSLKGAYLDLACHGMKAEELSFNLPNNAPNPEQQTIFRDMLTQLSDDGKEIVNAVLESADDLIEMFGDRKLTRSTLRQYFLRRWNSRRGEHVQNRISQAFREIQTSLEI